MKLFGLLLCVFALGAQAQSWPAKLVRITSPYSTGITPDVVGRVLAERLTRYWSQQVIVEARPGANGFIAFGVVKKAPPDGHDLLLVANSFMTVNPHLLKDVPYDPENDFVPLSLISRAPFFLWVASASPYRSVADLVAAARQTPDRLTYSHGALGSPTHLGGALLALLTGTRMVAVHFKEGPQMYTSIVNGDVVFNVSTIGSVASLVKAGRLRPLASASLARNPDLPEVPTVQESGGPAGYEVEAWQALVAPRGTPAAIVSRIAADVARALGEPEVREKFRGLGVYATSSTPAALAAIISSESRRNAELIARLGIKPD
jgi:tripartite-type tricarboxylate transporter receptor subunit TctC